MALICVFAGATSYWPERINTTKLEEVMRNLMNEKSETGQWYLIEA
jgi:hypothetical protein